MARQNNDDDLFLDMDDDMALGDDILGGDTAQQVAQADAGAATPQDDFLQDTAVPGQLALDVYQTKEDIVVVAPVPGVTKNDIDLSLVENTLTIRGSRKPATEVPENDYFAQELHWGEFSRSIVLPTQVKEDGAEAVLKDGMLAVKVPKAEQEKVKKIEIQ